MWPALKRVIEPIALKVRDLAETVSELSILFQHHLECQKESREHRAFK